MSLLVKNVHVVGGDRDYGERADVFVTGDTISAIGHFPDKRAHQVIEGMGAHLAPGFIDVNTDSDHYLSLFDNPGQEDFLKQGVTTIIGGNCGSSLAPLLYGSLESIQKWTDVGSFNVNWHTVSEFFKTLEKKPLGVNFGTLAGHSTIRRAIVGEELRDLTVNELTVFIETLRRALREGALGFSTGLGYVHSRQTPYAEIKALAEVVEAEGGVYATHLRDSGAGLEKSIEETLMIQSETRVRTLVSHFMPLKGGEKQYELALKRIEGLPEDANLHFDIYPFERTVMPLYSFLPLWAQNGGIRVMLHNVRDEWMQPRILEDMPRRNPYDLTVGQAPGNETLVGKTLAELMDIYGTRDSRTALLKFMTFTNLKAAIYCKNISAKLIARGIKSPRSIVASNAASLGENRHAAKIERATDTFPKFLALAEQEQLMSLADAIRKITLVPARKFGLTGRGIIQEGYFADFAGFKNGKVIFTVVNGSIAVKDGTFQRVFSGRPLRRNG